MIVKLLLTEDQFADLAVFLAAKENTFSSGLEEMCRTSCFKKDLKAFGAAKDVPELFKWEGAGRFATLLKAEPSRHFSRMSVTLELAEALLLGKSDDNDVENFFAVTTPQRFLIDLFAAIGMFPVTLQEALQYHPKY